MNDGSSRNDPSGAIVHSARYAVLSVLVIVFTVAGVSCFPRVRVTPPPADAPASEVALSGAAVMIGAGDIGMCGSRGDELTAALVDSVLKADSAAKVEDIVFTLGDHAYPSGSERDFARCFTPSWGDSSKRIMKWIRPAVGNHEYETQRAAPYYAYFGEKAGPPGKGYYAYDIGEWRVIVLNSETLVDPGLLIEGAAAQLDWLRKDLTDHKKLCTLAYFHRPLYSSGGHGSDVLVRALWNILYEGGVELILNGHEHHYERFLPQNPAGVLDTLKGIEQIIVGTGGADLRGLRNPLVRNSAVQVQGHFGVLKLTLGAGEYRRAFLATDGRIWDRGGRKCH